MLVSGGTPLSFWGAALTIMSNRSPVADLATAKNETVVLSYLKLVNLLS